MRLEPMNEVNLSTPRSLGQIFDLVVVSHLRRPVLFLTMALSVVAPYTLIVLAATGATPLGESHVRAETILLIDIVSFALVGPLVSVLHVHALALIGEGTRPSFAAVYRPALKVLPVAAAAQIVAGIGIGAGIVVFIIPGLILAVRLAVVAQVAAMQRTDWMGALRGSFELTRSNGWHVFGALLVAGVFEFALAAAAEAVAGSHTHVQQVVLAIVVGTIGQSFTAMTAAVLYFDLRAR